MPDNVQESIKKIFDLTSRIDERVKILIEQQEATAERIENLMSRNEAVTSRVSVLESKNGNMIHAELNEMRREIDAMRVRLGRVEFSTSAQDNKWRLAGEFVFKLAVVVLGGILVWHFTGR